MSIIAKPTKLTIAPTVTSPLRLSDVPSAKIATIVSVLAARLATDSQAQPRSTGYCAASARRIRSRIAATSAPSRVKLCTTSTLPNTSPARSEIA
ncbi:hypothetical protein EV148_10868 [Dokdonella fugitiva]|uniref:Uncharacterized protein n=1 Tax=Dokdonella fugitiva TaxID=328517 RepID=A0A4R2I2U4_9GAMM|nr:hypothetical protein EV148_10868 [Dokdonella fugitiva]